MLQVGKAEEPSRGAAVGQWTVLQCPGGSDVPAVLRLLPLPLSPRPLPPVVWFSLGWYLQPLLPSPPPPSSPSSQLVTRYLATVAAVYHRPPETFVSRQRLAVARAEELGSRKFEVGRLMCVWVCGGCGVKVGVGWSGVGRGWLVSGAVNVSGKGDGERGGEEELVFSRVPVQMLMA